MDQSASTKVHRGLFSNLVTQITVCHCLGLYYDLAQFKTDTTYKAGISLPGLQKQGQEAEENHFTHSMAQPSQILWAHISVQESRS